MSTAGEDSRIIATSPQPAVPDSKDLYRAVSASVCMGTLLTAFPP